MKKILLCLIVVSLLTACGETKWEEVIVNDQYSMLLPDYLEKTSRLKPEASLQYENTSKQTFILVLDSKKITLDSIKDFNDYYKLIDNEYHLLDSNLQKIQAKAMEINGSKAIYYEYTLHPKQVPSRFIGAVIETKEFLYHVVAWTKEANLNSYGEDLRKAVISLKEI